MLSNMTIEKKEKVYYAVMERMTCTWGEGNDKGVKFFDYSFTSVNKTEKISKAKYEEFLDFYKLNNRHKSNIINYNQHNYEDYFIVRDLKIDNLPFNYNLEKFVSVLNEKSTLMEIKKGLKKLKECLELNNKEIADWETNKIYSENYIEEKIKELNNDNEKVSNYIIVLEELIVKKSDKKSNTKIKRIKKEISNLEKEKWKYSDEYYEILLNEIFLRNEITEENKSNFI